MLPQKIVLDQSFYILTFHYHFRFSLVGHPDEVRSDQVRIDRYKKLYEKLKVFRDEPVDESEFFEIYCKAMVNSITSQSIKGEETGIILDTHVSWYNHSCRPNCSILFDGYYIFLRPLTNDIDTGDVNKATISYTDVGRSRYQRRKELKSKW